MAAAFDCPNCGGPLDFEPEPGDLSVVCSFCNQTVLIPPDMRIPLPPVDLPPADSTPVRKTNWVFIAIILFLVFAAAKSMFNSAIEYVRTNVPTLLGRAAETAQPTADVQASLLTNQQLVKQEQGWPASLSEKFIDNSHEWLTGDVKDAYITGTRTISNGAYQWDVTALKSGINMTFPTLPDQWDFLASVDIKYSQMPDDPFADAGLILRYTGSEHSFFYYSLNDKGQYYFGWHDQSGWTNIISEKDSSAFHPGETNRLSVGVSGGEFNLLINDQIVDHVTNFNANSGQVGVGVNLTQPDDRARVEFSNFVVLTSTSNPVK